jgi:hypothetical protein
VAVAKTAIKEREADVGSEGKDVANRVKDRRWQPMYLPIRKIEKNLEKPRHEHRSE